MIISKEKFEFLVAEALDSLPDKFKANLHNVAIFVEDCISKAQLKKTGRTRGAVIFGLFEGYAQAKRLNFGPVLPDRITIFRRAICDFYSSEDEIKKSIISTIKHEIAHHFGSDEKGASKASKN